MQVTGGQPIPLRTYNQAYLAQVERWWADLLPRFNRHLFHNGGPVVMIQVHPVTPASEMHAKVSRRACTAGPRPMLLHAC